MNLNKKVFLVIVPVVTLFFVAATTVVYLQQKNQILKLEHNRLKLALSEIASLYNQYSGFSEGYLNSIVESSSLRSYLVETSDRYKRIALVRNIENYLRDFGKHKSNVLSLTVSQITPQKKIVEHIELSEDPFSQIPETLKNFTFTAIEQPDTLQPQLLYNGNKMLLAFSALVDPDTIDIPLATRTHLAYSITFAIEPTEFMNEIVRYEQDFGLSIRIQSTPPALLTETTAFTLLDSGRYLVATISGEAIDRYLRPTRVRLIMLACIFLISCTVIIYALISRIVVSPITKLEEAVKEAGSNFSNKIDISTDANDEIGNLGKEFSQLYSQLSKAYNTTSELVKTDHLTQQANLYQIKKIFQSVITEARDKNQNVAFLYLDLDNFKFVNDRYGHDIGDKVLISFSDAVVGILEKQMPRLSNGEKSWHFGRIAGDEFGIILEGSPSSILVNELLSSILSLFSGGFSFLTGKYPISASIGVVNYPADGDTPSQLITNADKAMYQSKSLGKNRVSFYSEQIAYKIRRELEIETEIKNAIFDDEFYLVFLPIIHTNSLQIYGFEALIRWNSPRLGFVSPAEFIPIAEACGYFEAIDSWVVQKSFAAYTKIKALMDRDFVLSVNLSSAQIKINSIQKEILNQAKLHRVPNRQIQFEMTETTGAEFSGGSDSLLSSLTDAGFRLAIDDFGTGYTSLQQLVEYPASTIKFDKSFLEATMSGSGRKILKPLVQLCHSQLMAVTVEGVETREQYEYLRSINVDHLQGFLFSQPATLEELPGALTMLQKKCARLV